MLIDRISLEYRDTCSSCQLCKHNLGSGVFDYPGLPLRKLLSELNKPASISICYSIYKPQFQVNFWSLSTPFSKTDRNVTEESVALCKLIIIQLLDLMTIHEPVLKTTQFIMVVIQIREILLQGAEISRLVFLSLSESSIMPWSIQKEPPMACLHNDAEKSWGELPDSKLLSWDIITVFCLSGHQVGK